MLNHDQEEIKTEVTELDTETSVSEDQVSKSTEEISETKEEMDSAPITEEQISTIPEPDNALQDSITAEATPELEPTLQVIEEPVVEEEEAVVSQEAVVEKTNEPEPIPVAEEKPKVKPAAEKKPRKAAAPKPEQELTQEEKNHNEMMDMLEASFAQFQKGQIVKGIIVDSTEKDVMVDIGFKSEGVIPISEFSYSGIPEKNSTINVYINEIEDGAGKLLLSKKKADFILNIALIKKASEDGSIIPGIIRRRVKGGMIVDVLGIEAFLPGSQMSLKPIPNLDQFIGKELNFRIVSIDEEHRNIILSRKVVLEEESAAKKHELLDKIEIGSELDGEVKNITQYGAFIDLGGIDGLLHVTDMSWGKINHPSEMLNIGDKLKVKVIGFDAEISKISLGVKQLVPHPWENVEIKYPEGTRVTGKVVSVKSFGAFVELEPGVEGLVHISEMSWTKKITDARRITKVGDTVNAIILDMDKENRRISLGMKQMEANPWLSIEDHYPVGTVLERKIKSLTAFGAFVEIEDGIDGLIHISDISWTKRIYHPREVFKKNQDVKAVVLSIDRALHRVALGIKQLKNDPWETLNHILPVNTEIKGKISKLIPKGVLVDIEVGEDVVEGFIPISHLALPKLEHSEEAFHIGEELPLKVIELDMENRRLILSVKAFFFSRDPKLQADYIAIHEQFMRERIIRQNKKKADKEARDKGEFNTEEGTQADELTPDNEVDTVVEPITKDEVKASIEAEEPIMEDKQIEPVEDAEVEEQVDEIAEETAPETSEEVIPEESLEPEASTQEEIAEEPVEETEESISETTEKEITE